MNTTSEILKAYAPEFVALEEAERRNFTNSYGAIECFLCDGFGDYDNVNYNIRPLLDAYAQALVRLEKAKEVLKFSVQGGCGTFCQGHEDEARCNCGWAKAKALLKELGEGS